VVEALRARNADCGSDLPAAVEAYKSACGVRATTAGQAAQGPSLEAQLAAREVAESAAAAAASRGVDAERLIRAVASECHIPDGSTEGLVHALRHWQAARTAMIEEHEAARSEWAELTALLDGRTIADLEREYVELRASAESHGSERRDAELLTVDLDNEVKGRQQILDQALTVAGRARGQADQHARSMPNVAEAEEELARSEATLESVQILDRMLSRTIEFLESAQVRTHRDIASRLNAEIRGWLPRITNARYIDARVDPENLMVEISDAAGHWRKATLLSHGTAEQVYLLLRIAMVKHLAVSGKSCPLILDDVTVQCDRERTTALLTALRAISEERQVILFTQEDDVLEWARSNVRTPEDRLIELDAVLAT
jgi:exonuclease SbcC